MKAMGTMRKVKVLCVGVVMFFVMFAYGQEDTTQTKGRVIDELTYQNHHGLPKAASKVYFTDQKFAISGFGEKSYINYRGPKDLSSQDIELYMTNLYRFVTYAAYKPAPWLVLYGEIFGELLQDRNLEQHPEYFIEAFADFLISDYFNMRVGTSQVQIGYVNNNDEPIDFYSVNRPEVERLIIPSQWIDLGVVTYGKIVDNLNYSVSVYQGLDSRNYNGGTWIRRGRDDEFRFNFNSTLLNGQLNYFGLENTMLSLSGVWTQAGSNEVVNIGQTSSKVRANTFLLSSFVRHEMKDWTFMFLGSYGMMDETDKIFHLTRPADNFEMPGQVLGSQVYGYYGEIGYNILSLFNKEKKSEKKGNILYKSDEVKLPVFVRYEKLNTHAAIHQDLVNEFRSQRDMDILTVGLNFNPRKSVVLKTNYQFRWNKHPLPTGEMEGNRFEVGMGFIF
jgi:hypothetical protein